MTSSRKQRKVLRYMSIIKLIIASTTVKLWEKGQNSHIDL